MTIPGCNSFGTMRGVYYILYIDVEECERPKGASGSFTASSRRAYKKLLSSNKMCFAQLKIKRFHLCVFLYDNYRTPSLLRSYIFLRKSDIFRHLQYSVSHNPVKTPFEFHITSARAPSTPTYFNFHPLVLLPWSCCTRVHIPIATPGGLALQHTVIARKKNFKGLKR